MRKYLGDKEEETFLTTYHQRDQESGLDYRGARFYDADIGRFLSLDPLAQDYPSLSDYSYVAGNPIIFTDPTGKSVDDHYVDTDGNFLGSDGGPGNTVRVVDAKTWKSVNDNYSMAGIEGSQTSVGTAILQSAVNSTPLVGVSEDQPGYQKGISISEATWGSIENAGGQRAEANLSNESGADAYFTGEGDMLLGPGGLGGTGKEAGRAKYNPQMIKPGESVYGGVDGVKTEKYSNAIFKIRDGSAGTITQGGDVRVQSSGRLSRAAQLSGGGWQNRGHEIGKRGAYGRLQSQDIGSGTFGGAVPYTPNMYIGPLKY